MNWTSMSICREARAPGTRSSGRESRPWVVDCSSVGTCRLPIGSVVPAAISRLRHLRTDVDWRSECAEEKGRVTPRRFSIGTLQPISLWTGALQVWRHRSNIRLNRLMNSDCPSLTPLRNWNRSLEPSSKLRSVVPSMRKISPGDRIIPTHPGVFGIAF